MAACFSDGRDAERVEHTVAEMLSQRIYGLALGYEVLNDHEQLRTDPLLGLLSGKRELEAPLAGKGTLYPRYFVWRGFGPKKTQGLKSLRENDRHGIESRRDG